MTRKEIIYNATGQICEQMLNAKGYTVYVIELNNIKYEIDVVPHKEADGYVFNKQAEEVMTYKATGKYLVTIVTPRISKYELNNKFILRKLIDNVDDVIDFIATELGTVPYAHEKTPFGIYAYKDDDGNTLYIGKDSHINRNTRHRNHLNRDEQLIDEFADKLNYQVLFKFNNKEMMDKVEAALIEAIDPVYNKIGGKKSA